MIKFKGLSPSMVEFLKTLTYRVVHINCGRIKLIVRFILKAIKDFAHRYFLQLS